MKLDLLQTIVEGFTVENLSQAKTATVLYTLFGNSYFMALDLLEFGRVTKKVNSNDLSLCMYHVDTKKGDRFFIIPDVFLCSCAQQSPSEREEKGEFCEHVIVVAISEKLNLCKCSAYSNEDFCADISKFKLNSLAVAVKIWRRCSYCHWYFITKYLCSSSIPIFESKNNVFYFTIFFWKLSVWQHPGKPISVFIVKEWIFKKWQTMSISIANWPCYLAYYFDWFQ